MGESWNGAHPRRSKAHRIADRLSELESLQTLLSYAGPSNDFSEAMKQVEFRSSPSLNQQCTEIESAEAAAVEMDFDTLNALAEQMVEQTF